MCWCRPSAWWIIPIRASESFYRSTEAAYRYLDGQMDGRGKPDVTVDLVGHTHIDVAWLWRLRHTREKAARSFSTVNRLMEKYDHYIFLQSQPQLYEYIKEDYPDIYEHIKKRVKEGRWEPSGAMWVECDCNHSLRRVHHPSDSGGKEFLPPGIRL